MTVFRLPNDQSPREFKPFLGRLTSIQIVVAVVFALFLWRASRIALVEGAELRDRSENNFKRVERIEPPRGLIADRNGEPLAFNRTDYRLRAGRLHHTTEELEVTVARLEELLGSELLEARRRVRRLPKYGVTTLVDRLPSEQALPILERRGELPGLIAEPVYSRETNDPYPLCHVVGYTGLLTSGQHDRLRDEGYARDDWIGKSGVERRYERELRGRVGQQLVIRDARMRKREIETLEPARAGNNVILTLDADLQRAAWEALREREHPAVAILMDPRNGELLALVSHFAFDLNNPADGITDSERRPHWNRATQETYPPGSTFKLISALAAMEKGWDPRQSVFCNAKFYLPNWNRPFRCHSHHGTVDLVDALRGSCNITFYKMGNDPDCGGENIALTARRFGFGERTGIDLPGGEAKGAMPLATRYPGERLQMAIGQWSIRATPLQVLSATCAIANGGDLPRPHVLKRIENPEGRTLRLGDTQPRRRLRISAERLDVLRRGMWKVVNDPHGTAYRDRLRGGGWNRLFPLEWNLGGKTATATRGAGENQFDDAWFVGVAPIDDPQIAVLVMLERGGHGGETAAPIARDLLAAWREKYVEQ